MRVTFTGFGKLPVLMARFKLPLLARCSAKSVRFGMQYGPANPPDYGAIGNRADGPTGPFRQIRTVHRTVYGMGGRPDDNQLANLIPFSRPQSLETNRFSDPENRTFEPSVGAPPTLRVQQRVMDCS